jgi:uncharacterized membrane protein YccC
MTPEDIAQIRAVVREETAVAEQRNAARLERAMEALTANLSEVRQEITIRLETLERRFESFALTLISVEQRMAALLRQTTARNATPAPSSPTRPPNNAPSTSSLPA